MCVLLCANPKVHEWLDVPLALAHRQALQIGALCPPSVDSNLEDIELDEAEARRLMNRSAWIQAYCRYRAQPVERNALSQDWQKALEAIAHAWGRLLSLIGLRW